nr:hypothetical protein [Edwardsiella ictaluri]
MSRRLCRSCLHPLDWCRRYRRYHLCAGAQRAQSGELENFIQTDAAINSGNSGRALVNLKVEQIRINTAILAPVGGSIGIVFAIPSNMAHSRNTQLIKYGKAKRSMLGIRAVYDR